MKTINYQQVPSTEADDLNKTRSKWENSLYVLLDEGRFITRFIGHKNEMITSEDGSEEQITVAYPVRVEKPYTVDKAVSAAIMDAYGLLSAGELTAFLEDIARKHRQNSNDPDVMEFDYFIEWVRYSLDGTYATKLDEVKAEVLAKIDAYDESKAVNQFYLSGIGMWYKADKRATIRNLVESNIKTGNDRVTLWTEEEPIVGLEFDCEEALMMLAQLEVYAGNCKAVTQQHKANVMALQTKEEIEAYDYTAGYPDKLNFNTSAL